MASIDARVGQREIDRAAAEVEAAGGMEGGGAEVATEALAGALADALAGGDYAVGSVAIEDLESEGYDLNAEKEAALARVAEIDAAIAGSTAAGSAGPGTLDSISNVNAAPAFVDDFSSGGYATPGNQAGGMETFGFNPQHQTSPAFLEGNVNVDTFSDMPASAPSPMTGPEMFGDWNQGVAQGYNFDQTQQGHPDFQGVQSVGTGVEDFTGGGMPQAAPVGIEEMEMGMAAPMGSGAMSPNVGMLTAAAGPYGDPAGRVAQPGAITAGTVSSSPEDAATEAALAGQVITPSGVQDQIQRIPEDTTVTQAVKGSPEYHAIEKEQIDKSIITLSNRLDQEAKAAREKYGLFSREYQKAQRLANTFKSLDMYSKAYGATQGGSFLGNLLSGALPLGAALKGIQGWLTSKGLYGKVDIQQLEKDLRKASEAGTLDQLLRDLNQSGEGGMEAEMAVQEEVASFIQRYPWAAELDPRYIKYLIDNPAQLQDRLGEAPGGGNQTKPGGGGSSPPAGFTQKPGAATMALVEWTNPATGETWTAPDGSWQGPEGWVQV